jgi:hypothetical protein
MGFSKELPNCFVNSATLAELTKTDLHNCFCRIDKNRFAKLFLPNRQKPICKIVFAESTWMPQSFRFRKKWWFEPRLQNGAMIR